MSAPTLDTAAFDWLPPGFRIHGVPTNGTRLSVAVGGTGPTLVLLHGWPQTGRAWRRVLPALARDHTVVVPDLRGTGASERPDTFRVMSIVAEEAPEWLVTELRRFLAEHRRPAHSAIMGDAMGPK